MTMMQRNQDIYLVTTTTKFMPYQIWNLRLSLTSFIVLIKKGGPIAAFLHVSELTIPLLFPPEYTLCWYFVLSLRSFLHTPLRGLFRSSTRISYRSAFLEVHRCATFELHNPDTLHFCIVNICNHNTLNFNFAKCYGASCIGYILFTGLTYCCVWFSS